MPAYVQEDYEASKATQPEFYRAGDSLQYGVAPKLPQRNVELMVAELNEQRAKKQAYSRRCAQVTRCGVSVTLSIELSVKNKEARSWASL